MLLRMEVASEFASEVFDESKIMPRNHTAFDFGKPEFDLVQPGRIRGSVVNLPFERRSQELVCPVGFVGGEVVNDDVDSRGREEC